LLFQIYPTSKPRSKALAKKIIRQKRLGTQESDASSDEDNSLKTPKSLSVNENSNKSLSNKNQSFKGKLFISIKNLFFERKWKVKE